MKIRPMEAEFFYGARQRYGQAGRQTGNWTGRQTDMTKLLVAINNFVNSPKEDLTVEREAPCPIALDLFCIIILLV